MRGTTWKKRRSRVLRCLSLGERRYSSQGMRRPAIDARNAGGKERRGLRGGADRRSGGIDPADNGLNERPSAESFRF